MLKEFEQKEGSYPYKSFDKEDDLLAYISTCKEFIVVTDYDSVSYEVNSWVSSATLPTNVVVLEKVPTIATGKLLIAHGIKAYGNSRMLNIHYQQLVQTVYKGDIWTYPELTAAITALNDNMINSDAKPLFERLTDKEKEVTLHILNGLTNAAIALKMDISVRTVKAHVTSIFEKLHVNDRISLVLLLK